MSSLMKITQAPYIHSKTSTSKIMLSVILALMPATVFGIFHFGIKALYIILITIGTSVLTELFFDILFKKKITILDCSAVVTGLLLALNLPVSVPWWIGVTGGFFAIFIVKMLFGGIGQNFMNPALGAKCFLLISFSSIMGNFNYDNLTLETPLALLKAGKEVNFFDIIVGNTTGAIGETSMIALILGACFLILFGTIDFRIPGMYIGSFALFIALFGGNGFNITYISAHLATGGFMLGAFFMATDYSTRPITKKGQYIYGLLLGILTGTFRILGQGLEGVTYAILLCNLLVPLIEKVTLPIAFGKGGQNI